MEVTPVFLVRFQDGQKKRRIEFVVSQSTQTDFNRTADQLLKDNSVTLHVRTILAMLLDSKKDFDSSVTCNGQLTEEIGEMTKKIKGA
ncbi:unnamed protein product [Heligmosomoides polygyrus]|uniref:CopG family transcriptional regulator n=1 Tax=Heligmosomoides polygyrus TaxID=6339 RepID=A0A183F8Z7_HELPZ|nr:unnamed protein product [Heligmosomoides polygyrus]